MGELAFTIGAFNTIVDNASTIQVLGERYYKASEEWKNFPNKLKRFREHVEIWKVELKRVGISDRDPIDPLNRNVLLLNEELAQATSALEIEEKRLRDIKKEREESIGIIYGCVTRCCSNAHAIAFPGTIGQRIQRLGEALEAILVSFKQKQEARAAAENELSSRPYSISFRSDDRYVHFEDTENEIYSKLETSTGPTVVLVHGRPGTGKSTVARHVALHYEELKNVFQHVIFLDCGPKVVTSAKQVEILHWLAFNRTSSNDDQRSTAELRNSHQLKGAFKDEKILVVFDDVWEGKFLQDMVKLFGKGVKCLVTSRQEYLCSGLNCPTIHYVLIQDISLEVARKLLASHVRFPHQDIRNPKILAVADRIIEKAGRNPLALASVVSAVNEKHKEDLEEWHYAFDEFVRTLKTAPTQSIQSERYPTSFWAATTLSIQSLQENARMVLHLTHLCKGPSVPEAVIRFFYETESQGRFREVVYELEGRQLVKMDNSTEIGRSWSTHSLQKLFMEDDDNMKTQKQDVFDVLRGFFRTPETDPSVEQVEIGREVQNEDAIVRTILCALYFEDQFAKEAASLLKVPDGRLNDSRRAAFEPITRLLAHFARDQWTPAARTAVKQALLKYFRQGELDDENISLLLEMSSNRPAQVAALVALDHIFCLREVPLPTEHNKVLTSLGNLIFKGDDPYLKKIASLAVMSLIYGPETSRLEVLKQGGVLPMLMDLLFKKDNLCWPPSVRSRKDDVEIYARHLQLVTTMGPQLRNAIVMNAGRRGIPVKRIARAPMISS